MAQFPETRYAKSGDVHIAYQVTGHGALDLVLVPGYVSHLDRAWEEPSSARWLQRLGSFSRLIRFDKRGTGLSDRSAELPSLEVRMDDVRAVMDAVGSQRAALMGVSEGGAMSMLFAATYPTRASALVMLGCYARRLWSADHPAGPTPEQHAALVERMLREWRPMGSRHHSPQPRARARLPRILGASAARLGKPVGGRNDRKTQRHDRCAPPAVGGRRAHAPAA